jgi:hypothetical protein
MSAEAPVTIERLSVRWRGAAGEAHALSTRLRLERLIGTLDLRPPEMPPGAVLLVRRVAGLPPLTRLDRLSPEWVRQVQQRMSELYRSARPPASAPPDALCVVFADAADMLQQFTRAVVREPTSFVQQWYWRELVPPPAAHSPGAALAAVWAAQAQAVPPTLARLPLPEVCAALALLAPGEVSAVVRALARQFALPPAVLPPAVPHVAPPAVPGGASSAWQSVIPAVLLPRPLSAPAASLLGLSLALYHAPAQVRQQAHVAVALPASSPALPAAAASSPPVPEPAPPALPAAAASSPPVPEPAPPALPEPAPPALPTAAASSPPVPEPAPPAASLLAPLKPLLPEGIDTTLGGVLYLINLLAWLGWPQQAGLSGWGMLEALARALLECADDADPLWEVLAGLDGREPGAPLSEDPAPPSFCLPPQKWPAACEVVEQGGRLYLLAAGSGSLLAELPRDARPLAEQVHALIADAGRAAVWQVAERAPFVPLPARVVERLGPGAAFWAERMRGHVRATLEGMLGEPLVPLLRRAGRLVVSQTHIDLYMSYEQINIAVRRAGLDTNPGWVPDLGYIILLHFVEGTND